MKIRILSYMFLFVVVIVVSNCATSHKVYRFDSVPTDVKGGVAYSLPMSTVIVDIPVQKTIFKPGRFARYSYELLGKKAKTKHSVVYNLPSAPTLSTRATPDPDQKFMIDIEGDFFETKEFVLELTELGLLTHGSSNSASGAVEFVVTTLKTAAGIYGAIRVPPVNADATGTGAEALFEANKIPDPKKNMETNIHRLRRLDQKLNGLRHVWFPKCELYCVLEKLTESLGEKALEKAKGEISKCASTIKDNQIMISATTVNTLSKLSRRKECKEEVRKKVQSMLKNSSVVLGIIVEKEGDFLKKRNALNEEYETVFEEGLRVFDPPTMTIGNLHGWIDKENTKQIFDRIERRLAFYLAESYKELQRARLNLLTGKTNFYDLNGDGLKTALSAIDNHLTDCLNQFIGTTKKVTGSLQFEWKPVRGNHKKHHLLSYTPDEGFKMETGGDISFLPLPKSVHKSFFVEELPEGKSKYFLRINVVEPSGTASSEVNSTPTNNNTDIERKPDKVAGFYYRIPNVGKFQIIEEKHIIKDGKLVCSSNSRILAEATLNICQFGTIANLPSSLGSIKSNVDLEVFNELGSIKKLSISSEAHKADSYSGLTEVASSLKGTIEATKDSTPVEPTTIELLTQQRLLLELERDILALETEIEELQNPIPDDGVDD